MDQRRADAVLDLFRRVADGNELPWMSPRREREVGIVLHADTLFGDGPGKDAPGELRGLGAPAPIDPHSAAVAGPRRDRGRRRHPRPARRRRRHPAAHHPPAQGAAGRLDPRPPGRLGAGRPARPADLQTESYEPTVAITDHVRAVHPRCTSYDCARLACRCDLDHDKAWPRGPTSVTNLCPRCRRHHELKTRGLVRTRLHPDGAVTTTTLLGTTVTTRPEPCPATAPARPTPPRTQPDPAGTAR